LAALPSGTEIYTVGDDKMTAPTPLKLRLLRGNPSHRPIKPEPQPASAPKCPEPPAHLSEYAVHEWRRIGPELHRLGLLSILDESAFAAYCQSYGLWRAAEERLSKKDLLAPGSERNKVPNPLLKIACQAARDLIRFGSEFGLTLSARARVAAGYEPRPSRFDGLLGPLGA
jgi:P27 family predicted phage terminase small subunit